MKSFWLLFISCVGLLISCSGSADGEPDPSDSAVAVAADTAAAVDSLVILQEEDSNYRVAEMVGEDLLYGYRNKNHDLIISHQFELAGDFYEGVAPVIKNGKHGLCDTTGELRHEFEDYEFAVIYNEPGGVYELAGNANGFFMVTNGSGKYGFVNTENELVVPMEYDWAWAFSEGKAMVEKDDKYGFVNEQGELVTDLKYESAHSYSDGLAAVLIGDKFGFINHDNELVIKPQFMYVSNFSEGLCAVTKQEWGNFYYINQQGTRAFEGVFEEADSFHNGEAYVRKRGVCRVIDKTGKELKKLDYDCFARC